MINILDPQFGLYVDGINDDAPAVSAAFAAIGEAKQVYFPPANYLFKTPVVISNSRVHIRGDGMYATTIRFNPLTHGSCFKVDGGGSVVYQGSIRDIGFISDDNTCVKTAIELVDVSGYQVSDVAVIGTVQTLPGGIFWADQSNQSIGLKIRGREAVSVSRLYISANLPINLANNPNSAIDVDHFHFQDLYLTAANRPCVAVEAGVTLTQCTFDGYQAWTRGTHGFYWVDQSANGSSFGLTIKNLRTEQGQDQNAYSVYVDNSYALWHLKLENVLLDSARNGVLTRGVQSVDCDNVIYPAAGKTAINSAARNANYKMNFNGCLFQSNSYASLINYTQEWGVANPDPYSPIPSDAIYKYAP